MSVFDTVRELGSFRTAKKRPVAREKIGKIVEAGRHAPSPGNVQATEFIVVDSEESLRKLSTAAGDPRLEEVPTAVIVIEDEQRMKREVGESFEQACTSESTCAVHNMRLVAREMDISSCWVTGFDQHQVNSEFRIPEGKKAHGIVGVCHAQEEIEPERRYGMNEIVFYESYGNQVGSVFDSLEWEGVYEESEKLIKKLKGAFWKLRDAAARVI